MNTPPAYCPAYWMPFTACRNFVDHPRHVVSARGMYYQDNHGHPILDGTSGLWCVNAGHGRPEISQAIQEASQELDYAPAFHMGHPRAFECAKKLASMLPEDMNHIFFVNSGSEAVETALKIAIAHHRIKHGTESATLIGRMRDYHGVCFGGLSVGGIDSNKNMFRPLLPNVDHLRDTHDLQRNAFSRGQPKHGAEFADEWLLMIEKYGAKHIAALIIEPMAGSTGVLVPPQGYLERLAQHCQDHGIPLILDEVITGFGRLGHVISAQRFGIQADIVTLAKGLTNGAVPMGAVAVRDDIARVILERDIPKHGIEFPHGHTYSGHPLACAAALATMDIYVKEDLFAQARAKESEWEEQIHRLKKASSVIDIRTIGITAGIEIDEAGREGLAFAIYRKCFEKGLLVRSSHNVIALSPPLIISSKEMTWMVDTLRQAIDEIV